MDDLRKIINGMEDIARAKNKPRQLGKFVGMDFRGPRGNRGNSRNRKPSRRDKVTRSSAPLARGRKSVTSGGGQVVERAQQRFEVRANQVALVLPSNPMWWYDCRMALQAQLYYYYKIERLTVRWVPTCAATQGGSMTIGALPVGSSVSESNLSKELMASPGGTQAKIWEEFSFSVDLTPYNQWYNVKTMVSSDSVPFMVFMVSSEADPSSLGYAVVDASYRFYGTTTGKSGVMTNLGEAAPDFTTGVTTNVTLKVLNVGSLALVLNSIDVGDLGLTPGDMLFCTSKVSGTSTTWRSIRSGLPTEEGITASDVLVEVLEWSRTGGD